MIHLVEAVDSLLAKMAIRRVLDYQTSPEYYAPYYLATKGDGSLRPILNLKIFNQICMETLKSILSIIEQEAWLFSLDLKNAYLHVPIHTDSQK